MSQETQDVEQIVEFHPLVIAAGSASVRPPKRDRAPRRAPEPNGLLTIQQAAARLAMSERTLRQHIKDRDIKVVIIGKGAKRPHPRIAPEDIEAFKHAQHSKVESVPCQFTASKARRSGTSIFNSKVIAFTAQPRPRIGVKLKG